MRPAGQHRIISIRVLHTRSGELQSEHTPVRAHGVRNPGCRATFCGAAIVRMRSSAWARSATILLRPATMTTLRGPNATGAMRLPTLSSQWSEPSMLMALTPVMKRSDISACRRISNRSG